MEAIGCVEVDRSTLGSGEHVFIPNLERQQALRTRLWNLWLLCSKLGRQQ